MAKNEKTSGKDEKAERLAKALRDNLKRRKAQARARRDDGAAAAKGARRDAAGDSTDE